MAAKTKFRLKGKDARLLPGAGAGFPVGLDPSPRPISGKRNR